MYFVDCLDLPLKNTNTLKYFVPGPTAEDKNTNTLKYFVYCLDLQLKTRMKNIVEKLICPRLAVQSTFTGRNKAKGTLKDMPHLLDAIYSE